MSPIEAKLDLPEGYTAHVGIEEGSRRKFDTYIHEGDTLRIESGSSFVVRAGEVISLFIRAGLNLLVNTSEDLESATYRIVGEEDHGWFQRIPHRDRVKLHEGDEAKEFGVLFTGRRKKF